MPFPSLHSNRSDTLPLYTITGYTATLPTDPTTGATQVVDGNYANITAFEAAGLAKRTGQQCQIAGYPAAGAYNVLEARWNGSAFDWGVV